MAKEAPIYDLVLLLSIDAEEGQRTKILADVESAISAVGGSIERNDEWGRRPLAYEIQHQPEAEYHLLQFKAPPTLIDELSHTLRITDGVLRFRVIKLRRGTPAAPSSPPPVVVGSAPAGGPSGSSAASAGGSSAGTGGSSAGPPTASPASSGGSSAGPPTASPTGPPTASPASPAADSADGPDSAGDDAGES